MTAGKIILESDIKITPSLNIISCNSGNEFVVG